MESESMELVAATSARPAVAAGSGEFLAAKCQVCSADMQFKHKMSLGYLSVQLASRPLGTRVLAEARVACNCV